MMLALKNTCAYVSKSSGRSSTLGAVRLRAGSPGERGSGARTASALGTGRSIRRPPSESMSCIGGAGRTLSSTGDAAPSSVIGAGGGGAAAGESGSRSIIDASGVVVSIGASNMDADVSACSVR